MNGRKNIKTNEIYLYKDINSVSNDYFGADWVEATLLEIKDFQLLLTKKRVSEEATRQRKNEQYAQITYNGHTYWATQTAQYNIGLTYLKLLSDLLIQLGIVKNADLLKMSKLWTNVKNEKNNLTGLDIKNIFDKVFDKSQTLYLTEAEQQQKIEVANGLAQLNDILPAGSHLVNFPTESFTQEELDNINQQINPSVGVEQ